jgi:hypothetical protein
VKSKIKSTGSARKPAKGIKKILIPCLNQTASTFDRFLAFNDKSKIVVTFALQALADFAVEDKNLQPRIIRVLEEFTQTGSPAIKSRGRKLLKQLKGIN